MPLKGLVHNHHLLGLPTKVKHITEMTVFQALGDAYEVIATSNEICRASGSDTICTFAPLCSDQVHDVSEDAGKHIETSEKLDSGQRDEDHFSRFVGEVDLPESTLHELLELNRPLYSFVLHR